MTTNARRPGYILVLDVLVLVSGALAILAGIFAIAFRNDRSVQSGLSGPHAGPGTLLWLGVVMIALGIAYLAVAKGLRHGSGFARWVVTALYLINIATGVWVLLGHSHTSRWTALASAVVGLVIVLLLFTPRSNAYFD